ncbi:hypothetical protein BMJ26_00580, partial [Sinorhizobium medicae]
MHAYWEILRPFGRFHSGWLCNVGNHGPEGLSGILCGGPVSSVEEPLAKDDGELCLCLDPFPRRPFPLLGRVVK